METAFIVHILGVDYSNNYHLFKTLEQANDFVQKLLETDFEDSIHLRLGNYDVAVYDTEEGMDTNCWRHYINIEEVIIN